jgi:hypothetical protein
MIKKLFNYIFYEYLKAKNYPRFGYLNIFFLKLLGYFNFFFEFFFPVKKSLLPIDIIITIAPKDVNKLQDCLTGIKKNILHPIKNIFIIGKKNLKLKAIEKLFSCIHVDENNLLNKRKLKIRYEYENIDRSGWLYQQLLNYQAVILLGKERYKLAINSDTVFSKKQKFEKNNKIVFNASDSYHTPYFDAARRLLDLKNVTSISFTSHHIIYNKKILLKMLKYIEEKYKDKWYNCIIKNIEYKHLSNHSEFETYAQYVMNKYKNLTKVEYWFNKTMFKKDKKNFVNIFNSYFYKSLSFHLDR